LKKQAFFVVRSPDGIKIIFAIYGGRKLGLITRSLSTLIKILILIMNRIELLGIPMDASTMKETVSWIDIESQAISSLNTSLSMLPS
jgi:hypothetical protein